MIFRPRTKTAQNRLAAIQMGVDIAARPLRQSGGLSAGATAAGKRYALATLQESANREEVPSLRIETTRQFKRWFLRSPYPDFPVL